MPPIKLSLNRGIPQVRDDNRSLERTENDSLSLVYENGISATEWTPQVAQIKGNAVYADSPLISGRVPLALPYGDVTETITISLMGASPENVAYMHKRLRKMAEDAHAFWTSNWQINPVVLEWEWTPGKPQFAIVKKIDVAWSMGAFDSSFYNTQATITIERGYAWHGISPGHNPKAWSYIQAGNAAGFRQSTASLIGTTNHWNSDTTLVNFMAWSTANSPYRTESSRNFIDIDAGDVPGDAPALVQFMLQCEHVTAIPSYSKLFVWRSSRDLSITDRNGTLYSNSYNFYGDANKAGGASSFTSLAAETSMTGKVSWTSDQATPNTDLWLDKTLMRGKYIVFARMYQSTAGAVGNVRARVRINDQGSAATNTYVVGNEVSIQLTSSLHYMGVFNIPLTERAEMSPFGDGLYFTDVPTAGVGSIPYNIGIQLECRNVVGANRTIEFYDLVFMPIDECATLLQATTYTATGTYIQWLYDATGHFDRGKGEPIAKIITGNSAVVSGGPLPEEYGGEAVEVRGQPLTLLPNVAQRLYFMLDLPGTVVPMTSATGATTMEAYVNIVPRWIGLRDT